MFFAPIDWSIYMAAYWPGWNGIIERNRSTFKAMAERSYTHPAEATFWYNLSPRDR